ncbi:hypothetical protein CLV63_102196 [Murinocardiopsis flavida]|uniref:Uncharacterized protein n=1 Tax=Murinocardiopsis flavida TaxID=645275 RepID=A0A2P8DS84_9ACTN|nr:hypothetical protein [Murinocardiopsis flavida]PSL00070.1 hypothetical protein CLV63_102196 [Murinocardiopsis flavida]
MDDERARSDHRFRDKGWRLWDFAQEIFVRCPRCGGRAAVFVHPDHREEGRSAVLRLIAPHRLSCLGCGHTASWAPRTGPGGSPTYLPRLSGPDDPFFGLPLWLQRPCCGGRILWAYNTAHVDVLEQYVAARLRERHSWTGSGSLLEHLPAWMKSAGNRDDVLRALRALRADA